jgi:hypothetical protein
LDQETGLPETTFFGARRAVANMGLDATLETAVDGTVEFQFRVRNAGNAPVELTFPSGKVADVVVFEDDREGWRWSDGRMFTQALSSRTLAPEETLTEQFTWSDPSPGEYTARATLSAERDVTATTVFAVGG